jgi:Rieske Fe-S protein
MGYDDTDSSSRRLPPDGGPPEVEVPGATRRAVLAAAGTAGIAVALGGCTTYDEAGGNTVNPPPAGNGGAVGTGASAGGGGGAVLAKTTDIPVGGGKILADQKIVITQPVKGTIKAFTAVCTHLGCTVDEVKNGTINCPCHKSQYKIADGSVAQGPAQKALSAIAITVDGTDIKRGG